MKNYTACFIFIGLFWTSGISQTNSDTLFHFPADQYDVLQLNWTEDLDFTYEIAHYEIKVIRGDTFTFIDALDTFRISLEKLESNKSRISYTCPNSFLTKMFYIGPCVKDEWYKEVVPEINGIYDFTSRNLEIENCDEIKVFVEKQVNQAKYCMDSLETHEMFANYLDGYLSSCDEMAKVFMKEIQEIIYYDQWIIPKGDSIAYTILDAYMGDTIKSMEATIVIAQDENSKTFQHKTITDFTQLRSSLQTKIKKEEDDVELEKALLYLANNTSVKKDYKIIKINNKRQLLFFGTKDSIGKEGGSRRVARELRIRKIENE